VKFHKILQGKVKSWAELEKKIEELENPDEIGEVFEQFVYVYLNLKRNLYQIYKVYRSKEIPSQIKKKLDLEKRDYGVDGVFILKDGKICAYQAKFRKKRIKPSYSELSKFWSEAEHAYLYYTIANSYDLPRVVKKKAKHKAILVDSFEELDEAFFEEAHEFLEKGKVEKKFRFEPDPHQKRAIKSIINGFRTGDRGKYIAACGTGKTITALWIIEELEAKNILFVTPSLALIKQTLEEWAGQSKEPFSYLCVCSDTTVAEEVDNGDITVADLNFPVTTNPSHIEEFLARSNGNEKRIIFSTYQSLDALTEGVNKLDEFSFDIIICDEAHRTAGVKGSLLFSLVLRDEYVRSKKRLFMTATERLVRPWIKEKAKEYDRVIFSMDDEEIYGKVFERFNFGEAIERNVISDYKIIVAGIEINEIYDWIRSNQLLVCLEKNQKEYFTCAQNIFRQILLVKALKEFPIKKTITFHTSIKGAHDFIYGTGKDDLDLKTVIKRIWPEMKEDNFYLDHINSRMSAAERKEKLDLFKSYPLGIVSNARCLTEGVDVPVIDSVYFVNPKSSLIDIVQSCGRALRKPRKTKEKKTAYFIIPILIPEDGRGAEVINRINFETLHNVIQALRDQDIRLADWIDELNLHASKGRISDFHRDAETPIILDIPEKFDPKNFEEKLYLRIAEANAEPTRYEYKTKKYGIKERKSQYKRIFKTLGDYSVESYEKNLVMLTIGKFKRIDSELSMDEIKINNNNVSHTERLGLISKEKNKYKLTPLGRQFWENKVNFVDLFKRQMLRYFSVVSDNGDKRFLFPYRACLKILLKVKYINFIEFVFGLYSIIDSSEESVDDSVERIKWIRDNYPQIELLNKTNKSIVLKKLNKKFGSSFTDTDIWEKKTTVYNQYIYFRNHLELFTDFIKEDPIKKTVSIIKGKEREINNLLSRESIERKNIKNSINDLIKKYTDKLIILMFLAGV
jgi:predicted helicase